eukprot:1308863-Ditylum_brightwellii.AAC.1
MGTEMGKLFKSVQQCEIFSVANLKRKILTKLEATAMQHETAKEKLMARKTIVTWSMKCILATAAQKQEMSITEKCSDRNSMKFIHIYTEKCTALFAEIGVWNMQSPQGSVGIHCSASAYAYKRMKGIRYRCYMGWKVTGIANHEFGDFTVKPTRALDPR